jgi:uncharacterized membrane protein/glutaredoxin
MSRRRQVPWMHRRSRFLIGAIAVLGAINTGYITYDKLFGGSTACAEEACRVLASPYAEVFGLPLSLFGFLAYIAMAAFALLPLLIKTEGSEGTAKENRQLRSQVENWTWLLLFVGATAMLIFSGYLMYIMFTQFVNVTDAGVKGICPFCLTSAIFAAALFILTLLGRDWEDRGQLLFTGLIVGMVTLVSTLGVYSGVNTPAIAGAGDTPNVPGNTMPPIVTPSGEAEIALAKHLKETGAKMYGAYWCPHCQDQKAAFGKEAAVEMPYIECAEDGQNSQTAVCKALAPKVKEQTGKDFGFPTWEVNGKYYVGGQRLEELAAYSNYQGPRNFVPRGAQAPAP